MGSSAMIFLPTFIKTGSALENLDRGDIQIHKQHGDRVSLLLFFQNMGSRLKISIEII
jgi:hypothetical protein